MFQTVAHAFDDMQFFSQDQGSKLLSSRWFATAAHIYPTTTACTISPSRLLTFGLHHAAAVAPARWLATSCISEASIEVVMSKLSHDQLPSPVPNDIDISQALEGSLPQITTVAEDCGILSSELEPYGRFKAKVGSSLMQIRSSIM